MMPKLLHRIMLAKSPTREGQKALHTWIARMTVSTQIVTWDVLDQLLQDLLIPRLLALAQDSRHNVKQSLD